MPVYKPTAREFITLVEEFNHSNNRLIIPQLGWRAVDARDYSTSYGDWDEVKENTPLDPDKVFMLIEHCSGSDYSGSLVERSNHKAINDMLEAAELDSADYINYSGGHGTFALAIRVAALSGDDENGWKQSLVDTINGLADYPLADESLHSQMEIEAQNSAWEDYGRSDFKSSLLKEVASYYDNGENDAEFLSWIKNDWLDDAPDADELLNTLGWQTQELANVYPLNEQGDLIYFDTDRMAQSIFENRNRLFCDTP